LLFLGLRLCWNGASEAQHKSETLIRHPHLSLRQQQSVWVRGAQEIVATAAYRMEGEGEYGILHRMYS